MQAICGGDPVRSAIHIWNRRVADLSSSMELSRSLQELMGTPSQCSLWRTLADRYPSCASMGPARNAYPVHQLRDQHRRRMVTEFPLAALSVRRSEEGS